nr:hypothetical protein CFP56_55944 [Quercus suber]
MWRGHDVDKVCEVLMREECDGPLPLEIPSSSSSSSSSTESGLCLFDQRDSGPAAKPNGQFCSRDPGSRRKDFRWRCKDGGTGCYSPCCGHGRSVSIPSIMSALLHVEGVHGPPNACPSSAPSSQISDPIVLSYPSCVLAIHDYSEYQFTTSQLDKFRTHLESHPSRTLNHLVQSFFRPSFYYISRANQEDTTIHTSRPTCLTHALLDGLACTRQARNPRTIYSNRSSSSPILLVSVRGPHTPQEVTWTQVLAGSEHRKCMCLERRSGGYDGAHPPSADLSPLLINHSARMDNELSVMMIIFSHDP